MNRKEIYSSKTYEIYLNLINKHMETKKEFKDVVITDKLNKELAGEVMYYNEDSGLYEHRSVNEDISRTRFLKTSTLYALNPYLVEKYLEEGLVELAEDKLYYPSEEEYKQPSELEVLRDEIDGLKSTIYLMRKEFEDVVDNFNEKLHEYYNSKSKFWLF